MSLTIRKIMVIGIIGAIFLAGNVLLIANWLAEKGVPEKALWLRENYLTGTTIAITAILLLLLVSPKNSKSNTFGIGRSCPVCDKRLLGNPNYCVDCGSKVV
jgi:hypothetical protein